MAMNLVTVATFLSSVEANLARNRLEAADIPAFLSGEEMVGMAWLYGNAVGGIKLQVAEEHAAAALEALGDEPVPLEHDADMPRSDSPDTGITTRPAARAATEEELLAPGEEAAEEGANEDDDEDVQCSEGDQLAVRSFKAAVIGCVTLPFLLHLYSLYLLFQLGGWEGELSGSASRQATLALVIDVIVVLVVAAAFLFVVPLGPLMPDLRP